MQLTSVSTALVAFAFCAISASQLAEASPEKRAITMPMHRRAAASSRGIMTNSDGSADRRAIALEVAHVQRRYGSAFEEEEEDVSARADDDASPLEKRWVNLPQIITEGIADMWEDVLDSSHGVASPASQETQQGTTGSRVSGSASKKSAHRVLKTSDGPQRKAQLPMRDILMSSNRELEFLVEAKIGTPAQSFWLDPDSGSSDTWVKGKNCNGANCGAASRARYTRSKSSTSRSTPGDKTFTLQYGIGDVEGALVRDTFALGDLNVANFTIGAAKKLSKDFKTDEADGILGLGFRGLASAHQKPFVDRVTEGNNLPQPVMSFAFGRHLSGTDAKSEMLVGDVNKALFKGDLAYYDVQQSGYWEFKFDSFASGTKKGVQKASGIVDTGTSLIAMPSQAASAFWKGVQGSKFDSASGTYTFPCDAKVDATLSLPDGKKFVLNEQDLNIGTDGPGSKRCVGAVLASSTPGQTIFGLAALKSLYTVLDFSEKPRIGFAPINF